MIQGGDNVAFDGTSGESIYGKAFADEHLKLKFDRPGRVAMANRGPDSNHSQFFITTDAAPHLDGKYVVFGQLVAGAKLVDTISALDADADGKPRGYVVKIDECGVLNTLTAAAMIKDEDREKASVAAAEAKRQADLADAKARAAATVAAKAADRAADDAERAAAAAAVDDAAAPADDA